MAVMMCSGFAVTVEVSSPKATQRTLVYAANIDYPRGNGPDHLGFAVTVEVGSPKAKFCCSPVFALLKHPLKGEGCAAELPVLSKL